MDIFEKIFMISLDGDGVNDLTDYIIDNAPESEFLYPEDQMSDMPIRLWQLNLHVKKFLKIYMKNYHIISM